MQGRIADDANLFRPGPSSAVAVALTLLTDLTKLGKQRLSSRPLVNNTLCTPIIIRGNVVEGEEGQQSRAAMPSSRYENEVRSAGKVFHVPIDITYFFYV
jgi:hypothetical protein